MNTETVRLLVTDPTTGKMVYRSTYLLPEETEDLAYQINGLVKLGFNYRVRPYPYTH